eukprot:TRINITY_DN996_c0_g1_i2.p1 TRINITY_DN996_c0_g1~~TRINITY_DN996_c0_g1_i2.p1  ORF type:complete len:547 (-),score=42.18 TRINITY_DN996_c0_g1_i2:1737-3182(-)
MQDAKLVQKLACIDEQLDCLQGWERYLLKNQTLELHYPVPMMRAWDRHLFRSVVIELLPQKCILSMQISGRHSRRRSQHHPLVKLLTLSHGNLLGVQDVFYCCKMKCLCIVYAMDSNMVTMSQFLSQRGNNLSMKDIESVFEQVAYGVEYLERNRVYPHNFSLEDVFIQENQRSKELTVQIRYIKLHHREDADRYRIHIPPEHYFTQLVDTSKLSCDDLLAYQISWQLGIILIEIIRGKPFSSWYIQNEYIELVDVICNYLSTPELVGKFNLSKQMIDLLTGMTAVGLDERWRSQQVFDWLYVCGNPQERYEVELFRAEDFVDVILQQMEECGEDESREYGGSEDGVSSQEAEIKEAADVYLKYYKEAKALQQQKQGRRKSTVRRMSLTECYLQVMQSKHYEAHLQKQLEKISLPTESGTGSSLVSDDTDRSAAHYDIQSVRGRSSRKQVNRQVNQPFDRISAFFNQITQMCLFKQPPKEG